VSGYGRPIKPIGRGIVIIRHARILQLFHGAFNVECVAVVATRIDRSGSLAARLMRQACRANSVNVRVMMSGATSSVSDAIELANNPRKWFLTHWAGRFSQQCPLISKTFTQ